jgi:hypothetical protein
VAAAGQQRRNQSDAIDLGLHETIVGRALGKPDAADLNASTAIKC